MHQRCGAAGADRDATRTNPYPGVLGRESTNASLILRNMMQKETPAGQESPSCRCEGGVLAPSSATQDAEFDRFGGTVGFGLGEGTIGHCSVEAFLHCC
jgi:hypothetical protein